MAELIRPNFFSGKKEKAPDPNQSQEKPADIYFLETKQEVRDLIQGRDAAAKQLDKLKTELHLAGGERQGFDNDVEDLLVNLAELDERLAEAIFNREIEHSYAEETLFDGSDFSIDDQDRALAIIKDIDRELAVLAQTQDGIRALLKEAKAYFGYEDE